MKMIVLAKTVSFVAREKGEGDTMKFLDGLISNGIFLLAIGMVLYLATTLLAVAHYHGIFDCPICNNVETVSSQMIANE